MTEVSSWHPHATWDGFIPSPDGSLPSLGARGVQRVFDELASLSIGVVRMSGVEQGDDRAALSLLRGAVQAGLEIEVHVRHEVTPSMLDVFAQAGVSRLSLPLEGPDARTHDEHRNLPGEFEHTLRFLEDLRGRAIELEVRSTLHDGILDRLEDMVRAVESWSASRWLVQAPLTRHESTLACSIEQALTVLAERTSDAPFLVITQHAPFFLRFCDPRDGQRSGRTWDERNGLCIRASGAITPDPAIPLTVGDVRRDKLSVVFDEHPLLRALRDPDAVEGKCGTCEFRTICGGSRARALARSGNLFASDPACTYRSA